MIAADDGSGQNRLSTRAVAWSSCSLTVKLADLYRSRHYGTPWIILISRNRINWKYQSFIEVLWDRSMPVYLLELLDERIWPKWNPGKTIVIFVCRPTSRSTRFKVRKTDNLAVSFDLYTCYIKCWISSRDVVSVSHSCSHRLNVFQNDW